jgi:nucleotide-binding universal stress UspA family protein
LTAFQSRDTLEVQELIVKEASMQIKTILFPTDFSQGARAAMDYAISLAQDYKAKLILLYVIQDISIAEWYIPSSISAADLVEDMQKSATKEMDKWAGEAAVKVKDVERAVVRGVPFVEIIKTAKEKNADMIVIGTHGRTGIDHMLFGSTAEKVVRKSSCPVLTVRMAGREFKMP